MSEYQKAASALGFSYALYFTFLGIFLAMQIIGVAVFINEMEQINDKDQTNLFAR